MKQFIIFFVVIFLGSLVYLGNFMRMTPYQEAKTRIENQKGWTKLEDAGSGVVLYTRGNEYIRIVDMGDKTAPLIEEKVVMEVE